MRVLWISPNGSGNALAERIRAAGHQVVTYGSGGGGLPLVQQRDLYRFAQASDLLVVDDAFPLVRTRRSWRPHQDSLFFDELRRAYDLTALGPTPTVDLLVGDKRYLKKWCERLRLPYDPAAVGEDWASGAWYRANDVVPPGPYLDAWKPLFKSVGFRGYFELQGVVTPEGPVIHNVSAMWHPEDVPEGREVEFLVGMRDGQ